MTEFNAYTASKLLHGARSAESGLLYATRLSPRWSTAAAAREATMKSAALAPIGCTATGAREVISGARQMPVVKTSSAA